MSANAALEEVAGIHSAAVGAVAGVGPAAYAEVLDLVRQSRFGAAQLPRAAGGGELADAELIEQVIGLATSDPATANALGVHFTFVDWLWRRGATGMRSRWLGEAARGALFVGSGAALLGGADPDPVRFAEDPLGLRASGTVRDDCDAGRFDWLLVPAGARSGRAGLAVVNCTREPMSFAAGAARAPGTYPMPGGTIALDGLIVHDGEFLAADAEPGVTDVLALATPFGRLYRLAVLLGVLRQVVAKVDRERLDPAADLEFGRLADAEASLAAAVSDAAAGDTAIETARIAADRAARTAAAVLLGEAIDGLVDEDRALDLATRAGWATAISAICWSAPDPLSPH